MRRLPWVTFAVMALCVLALIVTSRGVHQADQAADAAFEELIAAFQHWEASPYLHFDPQAARELPMDAGNQVRIAALERVPAPRDVGAQVLAAEQAALDAEVESAYRALRAAKGAHPYFKHGLVTGMVTAWGLLAHMFMHAGWLHLLGNLFTFFLAAPALEDRWGRPLFAGFFLTSGIASGLFFVVVGGDLGVPLVGASGAIAGVLGAFFVRLWSTKIRFWYWVFFGVHGTFDAPAWAVLPVYFANEVFQVWVERGYGMTGGVAFEAHIGGFLFGAAIALAMKASRYEERVLEAAIENKITVHGNLAVAEALAMREAGNLPGALQKLAAEVQRQPRDTDAVDAYWDAAVSSGCAGDAAHAVLALIQRELSTSQAERAAQRFVEVLGALPDYGFDSSLVVRLLPHVRALDPEFAVRALRWLAARDRGPLSLTLAHKAMEEARGLNAEVAKQVARRLAQAELPEAQRAGYAALARELEAQAPDERPLEATGLAIAGVRTPVAAFRAFARAETGEEEAGWNAAEALGPLIEESGAGGRFSGLKVTEATPLVLADGALSIALEGGRKGRLALAKIDGVALAAVRGLAAKPVILIDLLVGYRSLQGGELRCVRLRSDRFDPRALAPGERDPLAALRAFVSAIVAQSGAAPLGGADPARSEALAPYADLASYERELLEVGS